MEKDKNANLGKEVGIRIMQLRDKNGGETQEALAASIGVSREIIQHWERGTRHIKADHIKALATHFNVSSDYLLGLSLGERQEYHDFAELTHFQPETIDRLRQLAAYGKEGFPYTIERISFECFLHSMIFDDILERLRSYLEMSIPAEKVDHYSDMYISLDRQVNEISKGNFHVINTPLMARTFIATAQSDIEKLFEEVKQGVERAGGWEELIKLLKDK